jgi:hypothetical protein
MSSAKTTNLNLHKWTDDNYVNMDEFNDNNEILDTEVANVKTRATNLEGRATSLEGRATNLETDQHNHSNKLLIDNFKGYLGGIQYNDGSRRWSIEPGGILKSANNTLDDGAGTATFKRIVPERVKYDPTLQGYWATSSGINKFKVWREGNDLHLDGIISGGNMVKGVRVASTPSGIRPSTTRNFVTDSYDDLSLKRHITTIAPNGDIVIAYDIPLANIKFDNNVIKDFFS